MNLHLDQVMITEINSDKNLIEDSIMLDLTSSNTCSNTENELSMLSIEDIMLKDDQKKIELWTIGNIEFKRSAELRERLDKINFMITALERERDFITHIIELRSDKGVH